MKYANSKIVRDGHARGAHLYRTHMRTIRQNLFWALIYNAIGMPIIAAAAMALSSLSVIVNSALLKRVKLGPSAGPKETS